MLNLASDQGFGLGGKIISGFRFVGGNSAQGPMLGSRNMSQNGGEQSVFSELSEFGANKSMVSLSVYTGAQSSMV